MRVQTSDKITARLEKYLRDENSSPFNYERFLVFEKAKYLRKFIKGEDFAPFELEIQLSSNCNLFCSWCIGDKIQKGNLQKRLSNRLSLDNIDQVVDGILEFNRGETKIEIVKFSGFIGEPLLKKAVALRAMQRLQEGGVRVGLFTNGVLLTPECCEVVSKISYVHISLDAGPNSFYHLKENKKNSFFNEKKFWDIIRNIKALAEYRKVNKGTVAINIGFVIVEGNANEIFDAAEIVKDAGADLIRYKYDITSIKAEDKAFQTRIFSEVQRVKDELEDKRFKVVAIHSLDDMKKSSHINWTKDKGCLYQYFVATIGSNGKMYFCDHNTMPNGVSFGDTTQTKIGDIWGGSLHKKTAMDISNTCKSSVCPPFGNRVNEFLREVKSLVSEFGSEEVLASLNLLRGSLREQK